jgi:hypothetical protein
LALFAPRGEKSGGREKINITKVGVREWFASITRKCAINISKVTTDSSTYLMTTGRSSSSRNHLNSLSDVMFSTIILVCLEGVGILFFCLTAIDFSIVTLSPAGVSDWYWMAVVEVNEGLVS